MLLITDDNNEYTSQQRRCRNELLVVGVVKARFCSKRNLSLHLLYIEKQSKLTPGQSVNQSLINISMSNNQSTVDIPQCKGYQSKHENQITLVIMTMLVEKLRDNGNADSFCFYSASSSLLLLRGTPDTARILCRSFVATNIIVENVMTGIIMLN